MSGAAIANLFTFPGGQAKSPCSRAFALLSAPSSLHLSPAEAMESTSIALEGACLPSYGPYPIVIRRALARSALGKVRVKTPSFISACIFS
jgi:hypothetical protein